MNLTLPVYRNSFHLAWSLLLLPPVLGLVLLELGLVLLDVDAEVAVIASLLVRTLLAAAFVAPLFWWRASEAPPAVRRWMKDLRPLLPGCLLSVVLPGLLALGRVIGPVPDELWGWVLGLSLIGCPIMGATLFGGEFEHRTMAALLSQPLPRSAIYVQKLETLAVLLVFNVTNVVLILVMAPGWTWSFEGILWVAAAVMGVFCTTPLFTLLTRSSLAGAIFTVAVPSGIVSAASLAAAVHARITGVPAPDSWGEILFWLGTPLYLGCGAWLGWRQFARLQIREAGGGTGGSHVGFHPLSTPTDRLLKRVMPAGWLGQLVRKELRLHVVPWLVSGILVALWALLLVTRMLVTDADASGALQDPQLPVILAGLMGLLIILVSGSACVAEERQLGTLDWQLTQPLTLARQWRVKIAVALIVALTLGVGLPLVLLRILFGPELIPGTLNDDWKLIVAAYAGLILGVHLIAMYASSFSRSIMSATTMAIGICVGLGLLMFPVVALMSLRLEAYMNRLALLADESRISAPVWAPTHERMISLGIIAAALLVVLLLGGLLFFGSRNFRSTVVSIRTVTQQLLILTLMVLLPALAFVEGFARLGVLNQQAHLARDQVGQLERAKETLVNVLRIQVARGAVDPGMLQKYGLPPGATPEAITESILRNSSPRETYEWVDTLTRWMTAISNTNSPGGAPVNQRRWSMDPQLMRRYGLTPGVPKTNSIPANPSASPQ